MTRVRAGKPGAPKGRDLVGERPLVVQELELGASEREPEGLCQG